MTLQRDESKPIMQTLAFNERGRKLHRMRQRGQPICGARLREWSGKAPQLWDAYPALRCGRCGGLS